MKPLTCLRLQVFKNDELGILLWIRFGQALNF